MNAETYKLQNIRHTTARQALKQWAAITQAENRRDAANAHVLRLLQRWGWLALFVLLARFFMGVS